MYFTYFALSSLLTFLFLRRRGNRMWGVSGSVLVWVVGAMAVYFLKSSDVQTMGPEDQSVWWVEALLFLMLLLGMAAKYLWDLIEIRAERNAKRPVGEPKVGLDFDFWDFVKPMLVSVIVFAVVSSLKFELSRATLIGSFQNGFFWQTIFKKRASPDK